MILLPKRASSAAISINLALEMSIPAPFPRYSLLTNNEATSEQPAYSLTRTRTAISKREPVTEDFWANCKILKLKKGSITPMLVLIELIPITSFVIVSSATKIYRWLGIMLLISEKLFIECCIRA